MAPSSSSPNLLLRASSSSPNLLLRASSSSPSRSSTAVVGSSPSEILPAMADSSSSPSRIRRAIAGSSSRSRISPATATTSYSQSMDQDASISRPPVIPASPNSSQGSDALYMDITVSDPVKRGHAFTLHTSYTVITRTNMPDYETEKLVHRRYSDFQWLHSNLSAEYKGIVIPPLPEKNILEKWVSSTDLRMKGLNRFLKKIVSHDKLRQSSYLKMFLQDKSIMFEDDDGMFKHVLKSSFNKIKTTFGEFFNEQFTEKERYYMNLRMHVSKLERHLKHSQKKIQTLFQRQRDMVASTINSADAFIQVGEFEGKAPFWELGKHFDAVSKIMQEEFHNTGALENFLTFCMSGLTSVEITLQDYGKAYQRVAALKEVIGKKQHMDHIEAEGLTAAQEEMRELKDLAAKAEKDFKEIDSNVRGEMLRYNKEREKDCELAITEFSKKQAELAMNVSKSWSDLTKILARSKRNC